MNILFSEVLEFAKAAIKKVIKYRILYYYRNTNDKEIKEIISHIKNTNELSVLNYPFYDGYKKMPVCIEYDEIVDMYYIIENSKRLYLKKGFKKTEAIEYYRGISAEQDKYSPHKYTVPGFEVDLDSIVLDLGAAEGNFVFRNLDKIRKAVIVECDKEWVEALKMTFKEYKNVEIINALVSDVTSENNICIDDIAYSYGGGGF